jgi:uncharacterized damage-inducible protein DinB
VIVFGGVTGEREDVAMVLEHSHSSDFVNSVFWDVDLSGSTFRACNLSGVRIYSSFVTDLSVTGWDGEVGTVVIDGVDVTSYVASELDARFPERVLLREAQTADDYRAMWDTIEGLWAQALARAELLPEALLTERVNGEWSFVETLRHLAFAVDTWIEAMIRGKASPYCALGLPPADLPAEGFAEMGLDADARPSFADVLALHKDHLSQVREAVDSISDDDLAQTRTATLYSGWGEESNTVAHCMLVIMREHIEHRRFALRDLAALDPQN